jgi:hypothetical protein
MLHGLKTHAKIKYIYYKKIQALKNLAKNQLKALIY